MNSLETSLLQLLVPVARLSLQAGLKLPDLLELLKTSMVKAALARDSASGSAQTKVSDSRLSVMTGVHRKDLRKLRESPETPLSFKTSLSSQVFGRWRTDPLYLTKSGEPRVLHRSDPDPQGRSFETLVASVSTDVHPRSVLDDLTRLGLVEVSTNQRLRLIAKAFIPRSDLQELWGVSLRNASDHLSAIAHNLDGEKPQFLEQALFSDELSQVGAQAFNRLTAKSWMMVFEFMMPELRRLIAQDQSRGALPNTRVSLGFYSFVERRHASKEVD